MKSAFLLDFDGPLAHLFEFNAPSLAVTKLHSFLQTQSVPLANFKGCGMMSTLRLAQKMELAPTILDELESILSEHEQHAAELASLKPSVAKLLGTLEEEKIPAVVVTNNSDAAVRAFFSKHSLTPLPVFGRQPRQYNLLKPEPYRLFEALRFLKSDSSHTFMVGDQTTDVVAALKAGVIPLGYAKNETRAEELRQAGAERVYFSVEEILKHR